MDPLNLVCLFHPAYRGQKSPILSCKTCCSIYVDVIKATMEAPSALASKEEFKKAKRLVIGEQDGRLIGTTEEFERNMNGAINELLYGEDDND